MLCHVNEINTLKKLKIYPDSRCAMLERADVIQGFFVLLRNAEKDFIYLAKCAC